MRQQLATIFGNCKYPHNCNCTVKDAFESIYQKQFFIFDDGINEIPVRIVGNIEVFHLTVNNESEKDICLVKTDNCLFTDDTQKCDCILLDDKQLFLAELKASSSGTRSTKRKKAKEQLLATIKLLDDNKIDRTQFKTSAIICFKSTEPKIINTSNSSDKAFFLENHKVHLQEVNVISF